MCGIAGLIGLGREAGRSALTRMVAAVAHRGPDDSGVACIEVGGRTLWLGHRRLSIQDTSPAGHQPMTNTDTGDTIVYNGEIYNAPELRAELLSRGRRFVSRSDTEVILHAFAEWGTACVDRLHGMYAFALYEAGGRKLHFARDPFGIKPLYYRVAGDRLVFASEIRALTASGAFEPQIDRRACATLFAFGAVAAPLTILESVRLLDPGTWASLDLRQPRFSRDSLERRRFWDFPSQRGEVESDARVAEQLRPAMLEAVRSHLLSDVPTGVFLSSGLDSSVVAALASEVRNGDIDTFTVSLAEDAALDENPTAERTARMLRARHHSVTVSEEEARRLVPRWFASVDQPSVDGLNTYIISRAVRERGIVVALSGLGGDEMFGGYSTFMEVPLVRRVLRTLLMVPVPRRRAVAESLLRRRVAAQISKGSDLAAADGSLASVYFRRRRVFSDADMGAFGFGQDLGLGTEFVPEESEPWRAVDPADPWATVRVLESRYYMGNMLLRDADVFGMAHGLEIRVPLLDRRVADVAFRYSRHPSWPGQHKSKPWLAATMSEELRRELAGLPKRGFGLPFDRWMLGPLREEIAGRIDALVEAGLVDGDVVNRVWRTFCEGNGGIGWARPWLLAVLGAWITSRRAESLGARANPTRPYDLSVERS